LHIPNYSKQIKFISGGFIDQVSSKLKKSQNVNSVKELVIWKIIVLISILVTIVERRITHQRDVANETNHPD